MHVFVCFSVCLCVFVCVYRLSTLYSARVRCVFSLQCACVCVHLFVCVRYFECTHTTKGFPIHTHTHMYVPEALKTAANAGLCILNLLPYIAEHIDYTQGIVFICMTLGVRKV